MTRNNAARISLVVLAALAVVCISWSRCAAQASEAASPAIVKSIGLIKTINGNSITLAGDSGPDVPVTVEPNARLLRMNTGDKDLKNATPIQVTDLKAGDRIRVRGHAMGTGIDALEVIVITSAAVNAVSDQIRQDWQKRGVGGIVKSVDPAAGTVTISVSNFAGKSSVVVHTTPATLIHRYSPDSDKSEDAKAIPLGGIQVDDQLRARGNRSADGNEIAAEEIYTGVFPQFAGIVKSIDASAGTLSVQDLQTKKTIQVKVNSDSQLHKIPAEMAQRFAMRLKSSLPPGMPGAGGASASQPASAKPASDAAAGGAQASGGWQRPAGANGAAGSGAPGGGTRGSMDFQQIVNRLPPSTLAGLNLQKGDAVVILATEGTPSTARTAITLLSGVEPILQAAPNASQAMMLTPWSLGGAPGGDAAQ